MFAVVRDRLIILLKNMKTKDKNSRSCTEVKLAGEKFDRIYTRELTLNASSSESRIYTLSLSSEQIELLSSPSKRDITLGTISW